MFMFFLICLVSPKWDWLILSMPSQCKLHHVPCVLQSTWCAATIYRLRVIPAGLLHWTIYSLTVFVIFCGLKLQSHSDDGHMHMTVPCSVHVFGAFAHAHPTMLCIPLVFTLTYWSWKTDTPKTKQNKTIMCTKRTIKTRNMECVATQHECKSPGLTAWDMVTLWN